MDGLSKEQSITVLSSPSSASPPSRIASILFCNLANTSRGLVQVSFPDLFAEGAAIGLSNSVINLRAIVLLGHLRAIVSNFAVAETTTSDFLFFSIMGKGPGQYFFASMLAASLKNPYSLAIS